MELIEGQMMERLNSSHKCLLLLDFLCAELMSARMEHQRNPDKNKLIVQVVGISIV